MLVILSRKVNRKTIRNMNLNRQVNRKSSKSNTTRHLTNLAYLIPLPSKLMTGLPILDSVVPEDPHNQSDDLQEIY
jgi:hypothetical protein